jgi:hypothetical protein
MASKTTSDKMPKPARQAIQKILTALCGLFAVSFFIDND